MKTLSVIRKIACGRSALRDKMFILNSRSVKLYAMNVIAYIEQSMRQ